MGETDTKNAGSDPRRAREDRLAKALRANLRRRKASGAPNDSDPDQTTGR